MGICFSPLTTDTHKEKKKDFWITHTFKNPLTVVCMHAHLHTHKIEADFQTKAFLLLSSVPLQYINSRSHHIFHLRKRPIIFPTALGSSKIRIWKISYIVFPDPFSGSYVTE